MYFSAVTTGCTTGKTEGEKLAAKYCGTCHLVPDPSLLDKQTWRTSVLPAMGRLLDVPQLDNPFDESDRIISRKKSLVPADEWKQVIDYYVENAPTQLPPQNRAPVEKLSSRFETEERAHQDRPQNTFLRIDPGNRWIYAGSMDSILTIFNAQLELVTEVSLDGIPVDAFFNASVDSPGVRNGLLTEMGLMHPNDLKTGFASTFTLDLSGKFTRKKVIDTLPRPVQSIPVDLDADGLEDFLVCGFGNMQGSLFWLQNDGNGEFTQKMLRAFPGAAKAYIEDVNNDRLPDIVALFAQAEEGIFLFVNKGKGNFETRQLLRFSPVNGSTYFELVDFDRDGKKDILYTCGDNADYSNILKNYHGVHIYRNTGNYTFTLQYFFPLHGAFKATSRDFDNDGDLDIAAISYFPDAAGQPKESFVYLEQSENLSFEPYSVKGYNLGRWITMDAGDVDQDGDQDIVIGSLYIQNDSATDMKNRPSFLLLRNATVKNQPGNAMN